MENLRYFQNQLWGCFNEAENLFDTFVRTDESHSLVWLE